MNLESFYKQINDGNERDIPDVPLHTLISSTCRQTPDAIASLDQHSQLTYAQLDEKSDRLAAWLDSQGIGHGDLVGLCCERDANTPAWLVGILKANAGYVPLDPEYPIDRLLYMAKDSGLKHVVTHNSLLSFSEQFGVPTTTLDRDWDQIAAYEKTTQVASNPADPQSDVAYVIYTSGSTGKPKGVAVSHRNAINLFESMMEWPGFTSNDRLLATTTLSFDISVLEMFLPLVAGGSLAVIDRATAKDTQALVAAMEKFKVNVMQATPAMWRMILEADFSGNDQMKFFTGGETLPRDLIDPMLERCGELWNLYGPTETTVYCSGELITSATDRITVGKPFANTQYYVVDENDQLCPPETEGELLIGGDLVTLGYLNLPERTAKSYIEWNGKRLYRSGDLVRMTKDGLVEHRGRIDGQIKFNGHRIELGEIDAAMAKQTGVRRAATVLREDRPGDLRLVGYLLPEDNAELSIADIRSEMAKMLPEYMVPGIITVVDEFKYTPSGKLDRKSFDPPSTARPDIGVEYVAAKTDQEKQIADLWSQTLQIDRVGVRDNFFEFGGNSIRAVKLIAATKKQFGIVVTGAEFFDNPTIEAFLSLSEKKQRLVESLRSQPKRNSSGSGQYAIVGMAARLPGAKDLGQYWNNLVEGVESIKFFTKEELDETLNPAITSDPNYVAARGIIDDADHFDAKFFRTPPKTAEMTCPQQRIFLELAWTALEDAGVIPGRSTNQIGIWAGTYTTSYFQKNVLTNPDRVEQMGEFQAGVLNEKDYIATRVAHALNLKGPAINVNTACSTSLVALIEACKSLDAGHCDVALAGASSVTFPQNSGHLHQTGSIFSPDGHCRPFDANGAGTLFSDGAGIVVIKRLEDALAEGDRIYSVVKGFGINNDGGEKASFSAPSIEGQAGAIAMAHSMAGINPETIGYIEAHGTATPIGDPIEVAALRTVFEAQTDQKQFCAIGSVKSNIGHTVAAAGVAGLIKASMSLHNEKIPATLHYSKANPQIDFESSPFFVCDRLTAWERGDEPRRAGVSSFGVGGTNAHVLLEEAPLAAEKATAYNELPFSIVPVSGKSKEALAENAQALSDHFTDLKDEQTIVDTAFVLQTRRDEFPWRGAVVSNNFDDAADALSSQKAPQFVSRKASANERDVVFMFPGQGSQYVRMGQNLYECSLIFRQNFDRCCDILEPLLGRDLREVMFPESGDEEAAQEILRNTRFTQPALFALGYSLAQVWLAWGIKPSALMGHSIGEFAAACVAGVFSLEDGLQMIAKRGEMMQALPGGSMMSVRLPGAEVESMLSGEMAIGSYNGPELCVVAGPTDQVSELQAKLEAKEVVCRHLHTSHAFHSPMMESIVEPFAEFVSQFEFSAPQIRILSTVSGEWMSDEQATDPQYWADHLRAPVRFSDAVTKMWHSEQGDPSRILIELGPRRTLATLAKQHAEDPKQQIAIPTLGSNAEDNAEWQAMLMAVASLWTAGVNIDWNKLSSDGQPREKSMHISLPTYAFQRQRFFIAPGKPVVQQSYPTQPLTEPTCSSPQETITMSRIPNIVSAIKGVFEDTSGFDLNEFDGDTTFFEMGLDSLVLTQTATALKKEMDFEVTFRQLLEETPTVDSLAEFLDGNLPADKYAAVAVPAPAPVAAAPQEVIAPEAAPVAAAPASAAADCQPVAQPQQQAIVPVPVAPVQLNPSVSSSSVEALVQNQLQIMQAQLQLLVGGGTVPATPAPTAPAASTASTIVSTESTPVEPAPVAAPSTENNADAPATAKAKRFSTVKLNDGTLDKDQQAALDEIIRLNNEKMPKSKGYAQEHRAYMADPRTVSGFRPNMKEMTHPIVVGKSKGALLWDIDGNEYIDYTCGFGSNLLGHTHDITVKAISEQVTQDYAIGPQSPLAGEVAKLFCEMTGNERMAFSNTGSEAVLGCTRLARNATGRDLVVMFNGDYHGILDEVIARGSKKLKSFPAATGIPKNHVGNTLILDYGDPKSLEIIRERMDEIAAVLVEPVQGKSPEYQPHEFLKELRAMTENEPTCLIFDEVITGMRIGLGGAQEFFGIKADLAAYGKIIGGGMPIGVVAGKAEYMDGLDGGFWQYGDDSRPEAGMTYFAGTFVRHPLTLAASKAILEHLKAGGKPMYDKLNKLADYLADEMNKVFTEMDAPLFLGNFGSLFKIQFEQDLVYSEVFFAGLRRRGMHIWDHRPCLMTLSHTKEHVDRFVKEMRSAIAESQRHGFMPGEGYKKFAEKFDPNRPPTKEAKQGKDDTGKPGWFVADTNNPGQFVQVGMTLN